MKAKILRSMCFVAVVAVLLTGLLCSYVFFKNYYQDMCSSLRAEAEYVSASLERGGPDYLDRVKNVTPSRITWIDTNGDILFDSTGLALENHSDRKEYKEALESGRGSSTRLSETISQQTYYYAVRLIDGTVLRMSMVTSSVYGIFLNSSLYLALVVALVCLLAVILANNRTKSIVEPINKLDLEHPEENGIYDELAPLLLRLQRQNQSIAEKIAEIKGKQNEFNALTYNMSEGFILVNSQGTVLANNPSALNILGLEPGYFEGKNLLELNRSRSFSQVIKTALAEGQAEDKVEVSDRCYMLLANRVLEGELVKGAMLLMVDITEKSRQEQLRREFSANVSHELRTPLTAVSGYAEIMMNGMVQADDIKPFAGKIYQEAQRLITLVEDILKISQLDERQVIIQREDVDLHKIITNVAERLAPQAAKNQVSIEVVGDSAVIHGGASILDEMVYNLCDNAIKYNKVGGTVQLEAFIHNGRGILRVSDTGIGIPSGDLPRVFERFYRVDKSHSKETGGTGLGLSIVKHGAQFHGAKVEIESKVGQGTVISILF